MLQARAAAGDVVALATLADRKRKPELKRRSHVSMAQQHGLIEERWRQGGRQELGRAPYALLRAWVRRMGYAVGQNENKAELVARAEAIFDPMGPRASQVEHLRFGQRLNRPIQPRDRAEVNQMRRTDLEAWIRAKGYAVGYGLKRGDS